jgi:hypothetical protein
MDDGGLRSTFPGRQWKDRPIFPDAWSQTLAWLPDETTLPRALVVSAAYSRLKALLGLLAVGFVTNRFWLGAWRDRAWTHAADMGYAALGATLALLVVIAVFVLYCGRELVEPSFEALTIGGGVVEYRGRRSGKMESWIEPLSHYQGIGVCRYTMPLSGKGDVPWECVAVFLVNSDAVKNVPLKLWRFHWLYRRSTETRTAEIEAAVDEFSRQLGLKRLP